MPTTDFGLQFRACSAPPAKMSIREVSIRQKNLECEAAHTRYGRMRGILNGMPRAVR